MTQYDILVIGGGASGMAAAIAARKAAPWARICVLEKLSRVGKKLLATGNGRCNLMNDNAQPASYGRQADFVAPAIERYQNCYERFWHDLGLGLARETEGRVYPSTFQASSVVDVLRYALREREIQLIQGTEVRSIAQAPEGFVATAADCEYRARKLILASGGKAGKGLGENDSFERLLKPLGHSIRPVYPALTALKTARENVAGLKGLRLKGEAALIDDREHCVMREQGEILFQEDALSGIAVMQLSVMAVPLLIRAIPIEVELSPIRERAYEELRWRIEAFADRQAQELLTGRLNRLIVLLALKRAGVAPEVRAGELDDTALRRLALQLSHWRVPITGSGRFESAQVMGGGADTREFDAGTMMSLKVSGLYACGELLNVIGPCGGYNLEWAWASGMLAGESAAKAL